MIHWLLFSDLPNLKIYYQIFRISALKCPKMTTPWLHIKLSCVLTVSQIFPSMSIHNYIQGRPNGGFHLVICCCPWEVLDLISVHLPRIWTNVWPINLLVSLLLSPVDTKKKEAWISSIDNLGIFTHPPLVRILIYTIHYLPPSTQAWCLAHWLYIKQLRLLIVNR